MIELLNANPMVFQAATTIIGVFLIWILNDIRGEVRKLSDDVIKIRLSLVAIDAESKKHGSEIEENKDNIQRISDMIVLNQ